MLMLVTCSIKLITEKSCVTFLSRNPLSYRFLALCVKPKDGNLKYIFVDVTAIGWGKRTSNDSRWNL